LTLDLISSISGGKFFMKSAATMTIVAEVHGNRTHPLEVFIM